jgi:type IV pilus assembly protein PilY1
MQRLISKSTRGRIAHTLSSALYTTLICWSSNVMAAAVPPAPLQISQVPMTITLPAHPQILLALGNSQSMDGDLSGAIYTGSGQIPHPLLFTSSSPVNFTIPTGFTPPVNPGAGGIAPYTVNAGGTLYDNSDSRLNVAKAGITAILNAFIASADFGLIDYQTGYPGLYTTWVYQMSDTPGSPGGFTFTSNPTPPANRELVPNPCYQVNITQPFATAQDCNTLTTYYAGQDLFDSIYMVVGASSDDAVVNDVLYAPNGYADPVCITYGAVNPATQFSGSNTLLNYEGGNVYESYPLASNGCWGVRTTGPTNAGYVPASAEVMYEERGFGYYSGQAANSGNTVVNMTSSGATPNPTSVANAIAAFTPFLAPETNNSGTQEIKAQAVQSPIAGLVNFASSYFSSVNPPSTNGCATQRYLVLLTDGLPTEATDGTLWPPLGSFSATGGTTLPPGYGVNTTNDKAYTDAIAALTALAGAGIKTYIIGMGQATNRTAYPVTAATLDAMAAAGGTGTYFAATSPTDVTNDLQIIVTQILDQSQSTASAAVNSTGLNANSIVYQSQFVTSDVDQDWTGNLYAYQINPTSGVVNTTTPYWSAQPLLDTKAAAGSRLIATFDPVQNLGIPFEWSGGTPANGIASSTTLGQDLQAFAPDTNGSDVLQYLRGNAAQERSNGGQFRNRSHILGDIVDSNPAYIGPSNEGIQSSSYITFAASTANRTPILYIGADDGMLHAFNVTSPPPTPPAAAGPWGQELFAYMPRGVYGNLINLVNPYYNAQHRFFVNGSPEAGDIQFSDLSWHSVLVGTEAAGGNSVYALDVTTPASINSEAALASAVLWDFTDVDMGLGYSEPVIANTSSGWTVLFGNGYNSTNEKPFLYALNPQTGGAGAPTLNPSGGATGSWAKIDLCANVPAACNLTQANGLSSITAVNSGGEVAGLANLVYAGDLQGNLWRIDISNPNPALWAVSVLFQAYDSFPGGNRQPITTKPVVSLNPRFPQVLGTMVMVGTGEFLGVPDMTNENVQSIYGVYDPPGGQPTPLNRSNLLPQTLHTSSVTTVSGGTEEVRYVTGATGTVPANPGWYMDLNLPSCATPPCGERVINDPRMESGGELVLTTYQPIPPAAGSCNASGSSYLMVLNFATGGSFTTPQFDATGAGTINSSDTVIPTGGTVPVALVGMSLGNVYASAPTIRSGSFTGGTGIALITESVPGLGASGAGTGGATPIIQPVILKGSSKSRTAWWEIRQ